MKSFSEATLAEALALRWSMMVAYQHNLLNLLAKTNNLQVAFALEDRDDRTTLDSILKDL